MLHKAVWHATAVGATPPCCSNPGYGPTPNLRGQCLPVSKGSSCRWMCTRLGCWHLALGINQTCHSHFPLHTQRCRLHAHILAVRRERLLQVL